MVCVGSGPKKPRSNSYVLPMHNVSVSQPTLAVGNGARFSVSPSEFMMKLR